MNTLKRVFEKKQTRVFLISSYLFSWLVWLPLVLNSQFGLVLPVLKYQHFLGAFGPCFGAFFTSLTAGSAPGEFKDFVQRTFNIRVRLWYYLFAVGSPFLFFAIAVLAVYPLQGSIDVSQFGLTDKIDSSSFLFVWLFWILTYGFGEQVGWRGYLLPTISQATNTATAAFILAQVCALWHFPVFFYDPGFQAMGIGIIDGMQGWFSVRYFLPD